MADQITFDEKAVAESWNRNIKLRNELAAQAGQPDNLEIGVGDATKALGGSALSSIGGMVKNLSLGDASRALRSVVDGSYMQGNVDSAVQAVSGKTSGELAQKGLLTDALGLGDVQFTGVDPSQNPAKGAASTVVNKAADVGTAAADKLDQYVVKPVAKPAGNAIQQGGEALKESMSPDAKLAAKSQFYTEDENGFHFGDAWGDPAKLAIRFSDLLGTLAPTVVAGLVTNGAVAPMITKSMIKRGMSAEAAKVIGKATADRVAQNVVLAGGVGMSVGQSADQAREAVGGLSHEELMNSPTYRENVRLVNDDPNNQALTSTQRLDLARTRTADAAASYARSDPTTYAGAVAGTVLGDSLLFKMITGKKEAAQVTGNILARTAKGFFKGGVGEGSGEAIEEGMQKNIANRASNEVGGTNIDPMEGVVLAGMEAGTLGMLSGGSVGAVSADIHGSSKPSASTPNTDTTNTATPPAGPQTTVPSTVVGDVDVNTAIKEVSEGRKVPGSFSIGKGPEGYRAAYINQGGELRVTQPYATAEEAQQAAIQPTQPVSVEAPQTAAQPTPEPTIEPDDLADVPAYLRQDSISDELKAATQRTQATPNDPAFAQALAAEEQGILTPIEKTVTGDPNEPAYTRTSAPLSEDVTDPMKATGRTPIREVSGDVLLGKQTTMPTRTREDDGMIIDQVAQDVTPEEPVAPAGLLNSPVREQATIPEGGPSEAGVMKATNSPVTGNPDDPAYLRQANISDELRAAAQGDTTQTPGGNVRPQAEAGVLPPRNKVVTGNPDEPAYLRQLSTLRVTKRGKPFGSEKEAQLASRANETPVELPSGGFGVADKAELEQALNQWGTQPAANFEGGMPQNQAVPFDAPNQSRNENAMKGRDEEYGIDVELNQDKDGFVLTKTDSNGQATEKRIGSGLGGVYLGRLILNKDGEFVQPSQIIQSSTGMSDPSTTPFKGTQEQRQAVVKLVAEIEFYRGIGDMGKVEQLEQKLFNVVNGNNTNSTTQSSESSDQAAPINLPTDQKTVGTPPATGLVVAAIGADGKLYIGGKRDIHGILSVKYGDEIRQRAGLKAGESTWSKQGFVGPDGVFMDREQAFSVAKKANPKLKLSENMDGELDALDYQESTPVNQPTDQTEATTSPEPTTTTVAETTSPPITSDLSQDIPDTELETQTAAGKAPEQAPQAPDKKQEETPWTSAETNKYGTINLTGDQNVLRQWATANNVTFGTTKNGIVVAKSSVPYVQSLLDQEADHGNTTQRVTNDTGLSDRAGTGDRGTSPQSDTGPVTTEPSNEGGDGRVDTAAVNESADGNTGSVGGGRNGNDHAVTEKSISVDYDGSKFTLDLPDSPLNMSTEEVYAEYKNKHPEIRDSKGKVMRDVLGEMVQKEHARLIKEAISKGKPVSDAALEDYRALIRPDLNANQLDLLSDDWITKKRAGDFKTSKESVDYIRNWGKEVTGKQTTVHTPSGKPVQTEYRLMEADELIASHDFDGNTNSQFPQNLQPRDRSRATARNQLYQIAQNPVPERLTDSAESDRGAPIVKGGIVESGNGRVIGLKEAYRRGNAVAYKQYLADHAGDYGLTAEQVNAMTNPVLVRERLTGMTPDQVREFTVDSNKGAGLSLGATEQANADAAALTNEILGKLAIPENGDVLSRENDSFLNAFGALLGNNELAQYKTADGAWNQAFKKRVENAIFAKGYGNQELLAEIAESTKPDVKNILTGLMNVSGKLAELRTINNETGATLANVFADAAGVVARSRREGVSVSEALAQNDMFGGGVNSEAGVLAEWLDTNARSAKKISDVLGRLTSDLLDNARNQDQADIFTGQPATPRTVKDAINDEQTRQNQQAANNQQKPGADLFGANPPRLDTGKNGSVQSPAEQGRTGTKPEVKLEAKSKIADFGEKIGGAKKDVWQSIKDSMQGNTKEEIAALPLSKIWPVPDYQNMLDTGTDPWVVALVRSARDIIPAKPRDSYKVSRWSDQVKTLRELAVQVAEGALNSQTARLKIHEADMQSRAPASLAGLIDLYMTVGHSKDLSTLRVSSGEFSMLNGVEYKPAKSLWYVEQRAPNRALGNWPRMVVTGNSRAELLVNFKEKFNELPSQPTPKQQTTFEIYSYGDGRGYFVGKKLGRHPVVLSETFTNVKDARDYRANHQAELADKLEKYKEIPKVRRDTNEPRVGEDMRGGEDVTPEMFGNVFGFRGVEFGNWVEQKRRQKDLNDAYDALMDLAAVLNIPPKALSLNGKLSMAFGARGSGGIDAAAAHFEPTKVVINLTKTNGAGSLGHEWWHALDNYFSSLRNHQGGVEHMTEARDVRLASHGSEYFHSGAVRNDMIAAFGKVLEAIHSTEVVNRSAKLDARRSKDYWTTEPELSARSFETYLINKLQDQDASNDYLANITTQEAWDGLYTLENDDGKGSYPYPNEKEIAAIRGAFDNFFSVIDHRTDEDGKVALFSTIKPTTAEKAGKGMKEQEARLAAKEWLKQFKTDIKVEVVADQKAFAAAMAAHDYAFTIQAGEVDNAAYLPTEKTILINASAINSPAKLREMMRHEILVHHGLRYVVGGDYYNKVINAIKQGYNTSKAIRKAANIVDKNYPDADMMTAYEELFAHYAQNRPSDLGVLGRFWRGIKRLIQTGLEKVGFIKVNESEKILDSVLDDIAENMRNGIENGMLVRGPNAKGKLPPKSINTPMFSRAAVDDEITSDSPDESVFGKAESILKHPGKTLLNWLKQGRRVALGTLTDLQIDDVYREITGGAVDRYQQLRAAMESDRNDILLEAETVVEPLWDAMPTAEKAAISNLMYDTTMARLHPDIALEDNTLYQEVKDKLAKARTEKTKAEYQEELDIITDNHKQLAERYKLTSKQGKELYQKMREVYDNQWKDLRKAIEQRIQDVMGEGGKALAQKIRLQMEHSLRHGPYFPLARFGNYVVKAKKGEEYIRNHFESRKDAEDALNQFIKEGYDAVMTVKEEGNGNQSNMHALGMDVMALLDKADEAGQNPGELKDAIWQAMLELLPDASYAKHAIHRKRIKGASRDGHRAYLQSVYHYAHHVSKIRYGHKMKAELDGMKAQIEAAVKGEESNIKRTEVEIAQQVLNEMNKRHELNMNPKGSALAGKLGNLGYLFYLGASPAAAVINITQNATVMLPQLGGKFGFAKSAAAMLKAVADYARYGVFKQGTKEAWVSLTRAEKGITADEKAMLLKLYKAGVLDLTQAHSIAARADTDQQNVNVNAQWQRKAMEWAGSLFHNAEVFNREVAALTAYRLLKAQNASINEEAAIEQTAKMVYDGHGNYAASNRPRYMRGDIAKVLTQFKIYSQMMTYTMVRNAIKAAKGDWAALRTLGGMFGATWMMAGAMGLPMPLTMAMYAIAAGMDDDDDRAGEASFRLGLIDSLGPQLGELIAKGPMDMLTNLNISGRTGLNSLWWRDPKEGTEGDDLTFHYMQQIAGPVLGIGVSAVRGLRDFADGNVQRGVEAMSPKMVKDLAKAYRQTREGEQTRQGDSIIDDVSAWNIAMQAMGFSSAEMAKIYDAREYIKGKEKVIKDTKSTLLADYFNAMRDQDQDAMAEVMAQIKAFNDEHRNEKITNKTIRQSVKSRQRSMNRTQAGVYLDKSREYLRSEGAFLGQQASEK